MKVSPTLAATDWVLPDHAAALQQSWSYGATIEAMGGRVVRFGIGEIGLASIVIRAFGPVSFGLISRGPIWHHPIDHATQAEALRRLKSHLPGHLGALIATPETDLPGLLPLFTPVHLAELALGDPAAMSAALHGKWRNRLRRAQSAGLTVSITRNPNILARLIQRDQAQQKAEKYRGLPPRFLVNWVRQAPKAFRIFRAMMGSNVIAEMLFLEHAPGATYQIGWTGGAGRSLSAHHLLMWHAMTHFADLGRLRLDLGTVDTVTSPGLARFKLGTGAQLRQLAQTGLVLPRRPRLAYSRSTATGTLR